ncbi:DUF434 domain-containing protein [Methanohalobium sp.]|uniref:DUF434 domain-containing protein n=1 Tax=Methanohalobium sp. TaxID=2837493 RepID=UPI00397D7293
MKNPNSDSIELLKEKLSEPARDIRYLFNRGYPKTSSIKFVSDHYQLNNEERHILTRVLAPSKTSNLRKQKKVECEQISNKNLIVDGYNVLIMVESLLDNCNIWEGDDGFVRDTRGIFRKFRITGTTYRAIDEILTFLLKHEVKSVIILFDRQISKSGELAKFVNDRLNHFSIKGDARTSRHVDFDLKNNDSEYIIATSDGAVIDSSEYIVDIPGCLMESECYKAFTI